MPFGNSNAESQRDSGSKPRVAGNELPWECGSNDYSPNGVVAMRVYQGATPLGLRPFPDFPQGSSFLATLGWRPQSRGDC